MASVNQLDTNHLWQLCQEKAQKLGFFDIGVSDLDLTNYIPYYQKWIANHYHGDMNYMTKHGDKRFYPQQLVPGVSKAIVVAHQYFNENYQFKGIKSRLQKQHYNTQPDIAQYARGRDYHKVIKKKLQKLANHLNEHISHHTYRVFTDSAPVLEKPLAEKAGLGWIGKNSLLINTNAGSFFFIGVLLTNIPFQSKQNHVKDHCGECTACKQICPTQAIVGDKMVDARKCISYLTIENQGSIPEQYRKSIGTRIFGCDDCQLICPWNRYAQLTDENDFYPRKVFSTSDLLELFQWRESEFWANTQGSPIRRTGYTGWLRNIAIALGNVPYRYDIVNALEHKYADVENEIVKESIEWALKEQKQKKQFKTC